MAQLQTIDIIVIVLYFLALMGIAWWLSKKKRKGSAGYFLAGRNMGWIAVGASIFISNIGSEHLVGLAGTGAASGLAVGHFEWMASLILLVLGWLFVPFYMRTNVHTMPEFLEKRYSASSRWFFSIVSFVGYVLTKISVALYAGGVIINVVTGLDLWYSAGVIILFTGVYTIIGGLRAVVYTDILQAFLLVVGSFILVYLSLQEVGGWQQLQQKAPEGYFDIWKSMDHPEFPWTGIVLGAPILALWYWCTDQYIVQRVLAAKDKSEARTGSIFAAYMKILPMFLFVLPGVISAVLYADVGEENSDQALPLLVVRLLGPGLQGLFVAALLAALMSSLGSIFNSCSTLITYDIYQKLKPQASEKRLIRFGRISTGVVVILGLLWIPLIEYISSELYIYLQSVQGYIAPPIAAVFLLGIFMKRVNARGAIITLVAGFILGAIRLILELIHGRDNDGLPSGTILETIAEINFLHFAFMLFVVSCLILVAASLLSSPPTEDKISGLTWQKRKEAEKEEEAEKAVDKRKKWNKILSVVLLVIMALLYIAFG